jgi:NMD protein affecting ribosome stability and mRNA decay
MDSKCVECGNENDLMVAFTKHKICGKCVKKNYKQALRRSNDRRRI